jgi:Amt family ammonium transporter
MLATAAYSAIGTFIVVSITKLVTNGIRVDENEEVVGLDQAIHGERAFEID